MNNQQLTTASGAPVGDDQNSLTAGPRGPVVMEDYLLFERTAHFNRERIPERIVHAKGAGAYGTFTVTKDITKYTSAKLFSEIGKKTETVVRFSTVAGELGSADTVRDPRGFAMRFYTEEGNWDMVGNNTPVFFIRDPLKFSDFIHSQKRHPQTHRKSPVRIWDHFSLSPESLHQVTILYSDRGIPDGFRFMDGFSSHTYSLINAKKERFYVKWHFKTMQGIRNLPVAEAQMLAGANPDYATQDLFEAIERGEYPKWRVSVQIMTEKQAETYRIHPFDLTKVWPHKDYPLQEVGIVELNRNPENYFAEIEQLAAGPANIVPGMGFSPDKVLTARIFSYKDAHRYRVGVNVESLPVNRPRCPVRTYNRDGVMFDGRDGGDPNYDPNSFGGPMQDARYADVPYKTSGAIARYDHHQGNEDYQQAGDLYRLMKPDERGRLVENIVYDMKSVPEQIQQRQIGHFAKADPEYGRRVAEGLGLKIDEPALALK
jgi:catalase